MFPGTFFDLQVEMINLRIFQQINQKTKMVRASFPIFICIEDMFSDHMGGRLANEKIKNH